VERLGLNSEPFSTGMAIFALDFAFCSPYDAKRYG